MKVTKENLPSILRAYRKNFELTQKKLSLKLRVTLRTIAAWEGRTRTPRQQTLCYIEQTLFDHK